MSECNCKHIMQEFYYIATPRRSGNKPGLEKAYLERIFLDAEEAERIALGVAEDLGVPVNVFKAIAIMDCD